VIGLGALGVFLLLAVAGVGINVWLVWRLWKQASLTLAR
jgi:hypothetical protein